MPAHLLDPSDKENVARILACIVMDAGGELRLKASTYDSLDHSIFLVSDYDTKTGELVLRTTTNFGRAFVVRPENRQWLRDPDDPTQSGRMTEVQRQARTHLRRSDEENADFEAAMAAQAKLAKEIAEGHGTTFRTETSPPAAGRRRATSPAPPADSTEG